MIELERTFLAKYFPSDIKNFPNKIIKDIYIPLEATHPSIRIRQNGDKYEITKKIPEKDDKSIMIEQTIDLTEEEFQVLNKLPGKRVSKIRYYYNNAQIDVFTEQFEGLVLVDFEFENETLKQEFKIPDFCLVDVTQEEKIAGGWLAGRSYEQIQEVLEKYDYKKLFVNKK